MSYSPNQLKIKIIKLLNLTTSNYDGEALNSIRKANEAISSAGITWKDIFKTGANPPNNSYAIRKTKYISDLISQKDALEDLVQLLERQNKLLKSRIEALEYTQTQIKDVSVKHMLELAKRNRELEERCGSY